jgi:hypothetical protein
MRTSGNDNASAKANCSLNNHNKLMYLSFPLGIGWGWVSVHLQLGCLSHGVVLQHMKEAKEVWMQSPCTTLTTDKFSAENQCKMRRFCITFQMRPKGRHQEKGEQFRQPEGRRIHNLEHIQIQQRDIEK